MGHKPKQALITTLDGRIENILDWYVDTKRTKAQGVEAIHGLVEQEKQEAYKKGYIAKGIEDLAK
jgi:hypothetical protein